MADLPGFPPSDDTNARWRLWASVGVVGFVVVAVVIGFFVISSRGENGVAGAMGIVHHHDASGVQAAVIAAAPPTSVAWTSATLTALAAADADAGRTIALQACAGCHGETGIAAPSTFPNLAGQHATALFKQLRDYADASRISPIMEGMVATLDDQDLMNLAAYFSAASAVAHDRPDDAPADIVQLVVDGDAARGIPPCDSCHAARGAPQGIPLLDGQPATYLQQQLEAFTSGGRGNDIYGVMRTIARMLTLEEMQGLAHFYGN